MTRTFLKGLALAALMGLSALSLPATAEAGRGWGGHGWGGMVTMAAADGAAPAIGAPASSASASARPSAAPLPPPSMWIPTSTHRRLRHPAAYAPVAAGYGPPAWSPEWYDYCGQRYRSFNARTGYFMGYDGQPHFCQ